MPSTYYIQCVNVTQTTVGTDKSEALRNYCLSNKYVHPTTILMFTKVITLET